MPKTPKFQFTVGALLMLPVCVAVLLTVFRVGSQSGFTEGLNSQQSKGEAYSLTVTRRLPDDEETGQAANAYLESLQRPYAKAESLQDAIDAFKAELDRLSMGEFRPLITEEIVLAAIPVALENREAEYLRAASQATGDNELNVARQFLQSFQESVKPAFLKIAESGEWPQGSYFQHRRSADKSSEFSVHLHIIHNDPPIRDGTSLGYSLPILRATIGPMN